MAKLSMQQVTSMQGRPVFAIDGDKIGNVEEIYYDVATGDPEWVGIGTGFLGSKRVLVPLAEAQLKGGQDNAIQVPYTKDQVKNTPDIDSDEVSEETERELYAHYGIRTSERRSETQMPEGTFGTGTQDYSREELRTREDVGHRTAPPMGEVSVSRHEEELQIGKREHERGRVRIRKWVESEPVSEQVELRRETAHVERERVDRPAPGAQFEEDEVEMTLHEEEPVVGKDTVERERIRVTPEEERRTETVRGEVRSEHVEVDEDANLDTEEYEEERRRRAG